MIYNKKIFFAVASLGLGHAQRSLPIIKQLLDNSNDVVIVSHGMALKILQLELSAFGNIQFISLEDYPKMQRGYGIKHYWYLFKDVFLSTQIMHKEHQFLLNYAKTNKVDIIFSDARYGFYHKEIPSYLICHQIRVLLPKLLLPLQLVVDYFQLKMLKNFDKVVVPDFKDNKDNLTGQLSHNWMARRLDPLYIGFLSSLNKEEVAHKEFDYLFITSGYLESERAKFKAFALNAMKNLLGKKAFVIGTDDDTFENKDDNIHCYAHISGEKRNKILNESTVIIARAGYTTIMDLCELNKIGFLTPTQNMTEQRYLAKLYNKRKIFNIYKLSDLGGFRQLLLNATMPQKLHGAENFPDFLRYWDTKKSVEILLKCL